MKSPEKVKAIMIEACKKVKADGWHMSEVVFLSHDRKACCPLMALAIVNGYNPEHYLDRNDDWSVFIDKALDCELGMDEWSGLWRGYDSTSQTISSDPIVQIGHELRKMFPPERSF